MADADVAVVGGGIVGMSVACGLVRSGLRVTVFDGDDRDLRASRGNFGLVWVQGKGYGLPDYARWTRRSATLWPDFALSLQEESGIDLQLSQPGGLFVCLTEAELEARAEMLVSLKADLGGEYSFDVLDHRTLAEYVPAIGPEVAGATFGPEDGHVNPLRLLRALHAVFKRRGGRLVGGVTVTGLNHSQGGGFRLSSDSGSWAAGKLVLAAGLGNLSLGPQVGLTVPVKPNRGQVLICERIPPFLDYPTGHVRQTGEGTVQLGDSKEDVGFNDGTTPEVMAAIAQRAVTMFPVLKGIRVVRAWGALRIMTADGFPIYQESGECAGAYAVTCHSGVTLAAAHAGPLADWIKTGSAPAGMASFSGERFHV
jgi:glycine/D-amino acid oxidase-like deaminating enzyme